MKYLFAEAPDGDALPILVELQAAQENIDLTKATDLELVWVDGHHGAQPLIWPMVMHEHGQDCARA